VKNDTYACINQAVSASCSSVQQFAAGEAEGQRKTVHGRVHSVTDVLLVTVGREEDVFMIN